ncbi:MAG: hypothetical protein HY514_00515 [Candidatus Aenigmarchaeota archaeon]|nr:hypothetical protein [Candidatus Aenigmarchaeota archaeon]
MEKQNNSNFKMYVVMVIVFLSAVIIVEGLNNLPTSQNKYILDPLYCEKDEECRFKESCGCGCEPETENIFQSNSTCTTPMCEMQCPLVSYKTECENYSCIIEKTPMLPMKVGIEDVSSSSIRIINIGSLQINLVDKVTVFVDGVVKSCKWSEEKISNGETAICTIEEGCKTGQKVRVTVPSGVDEAICP